MKNSFVHFDRHQLKITIHFNNGQKLGITRKEVEVSYFSGGAGGQNINRHLNGVRLIYRIPEENRRHDSKTKEIVTRSINQRKQDQNLMAAFAQLAKKLERYFYVPSQRKKTKIPRFTRENRLKYKKINKLKKQSRKNFSGELY